MDISKIQEFMHYEPVMDQDPKALLDGILNRATYITPAQKKEVIKAYTFAAKHHLWIKRLSGEEYIIHPIKVLGFLMAIKPDVPTMQAALLHDVIEDTEVTYQDIEKAFNKEVADLCDGLVKVAKVRWMGEDRQLETLEKTFLAMWKDLRVIIIKMADRVHNIQTLHYHPKKEKQKRIAEETLKVFVPIAKRLWLYIYQWYLENGAFQILDPKEFNRITNFVEKSYGDVDMYKNKGVDKLLYLCEQEGVSIAKVTGRLKSPYRIYKKLQKYQTSDISKVMDILAFRIIATDLSSCYSILWVIHKHYTPIFAKMKDYIAIPKPNGYKSLHTTVLGMFDFPVEIQVRTADMDRVANYWVAAHYAYSDAGKPVTVSQQQAQWIEKLQDIMERYQEATDKWWFKDELNIEILQKNIFIYTPKGDIIELPQGSTVLDFAFRVHTDIWLKFKSAFINGRIVPIDYKLNTGDIVDIKTFKNKYTAASWRDAFLHTPSAKARLHRYIRQLQKDDIFVLITNQINEKLKEHNLPLLGSKDDRISKTFKGEEYERLLLQVRDKQMSTTRLIKLVYKEVLEGLKEEVTRPASQTKWPKDTTVVHTIMVDSDKEMDLGMCPECTPSYPEKVIARSGKDGIKVHTLACEAMKTMDYKKLLEAHWKGQRAAVYILKLWLLAPDRPGILLEILKIFEFLWINLKDIYTEHGDEHDHTYVWVDLEFDNPSKISYLINDLKTRKELLKITSVAIV